MKPTIAALERVYAYNFNNPRVLYELAGAYDTNGEEEKARALYEKALEAGLEGDLLKRCYVQYGSTLRNINELEASGAVFKRAREIFPDSVALAVFQAITEHASNRADSAIAILLETIAENVATVDIERYKPAIRGNAEYIRSIRRTS